MEDRGTSSGWPTSRPPGTDHKHQICFGTTVHSQTDLTRWRLTSGADSRRAETRPRVLKTYEKIPLTSRREGESLVLVLHHFRAAGKEDLEGSLQVLLQLGLGDTLEGSKTVATLLSKRHKSSTIRFPPFLFVLTGCWK